MRKGPGGDRAHIHTRTKTCITSLDLTYAHTTVRNHIYTHVHDVKQVKHLQKMWTTQAILYGLLCACTAGTPKRAHKHEELWQHVEYANVTWSNLLRSHGVLMQ